MKDNPNEVLASLVLSLEATATEARKGERTDLLEIVTPAIAKCKRAMFPYGTMRSSHGEVDFKADTGEVIEIRHYQDDDALKGISRVDVIEWHLRYPGEDIAQSHDILDFGTWEEDGKYYGPAEGWREDRNKMRRGEEL